MGKRWMCLVALPVAVIFISGMMSIHTEAFAAAIRDLLTEPADIERLSRGTRRVAEMHSWDRQATQVLQAYEQALPPSWSGLSEHVAQPAELHLVGSAAS